MPRTNTHLSIRQLLVLAADAIVILYLILDGIVTPIVRPLLRWVAGLRFVIRLEDGIAALPPYVILVSLAVPIVIAEPAKIYALYVMSQGHFVAGFTTIAMAYLLSLVVAERIYRAGEASLRTIAWFAKLMDWLTGIREQLLQWARATRIWTISVKLRGRARELAAKLLFRFRAG